MDFDDERWVRLYTRDTPTWVAWRWEARALAPLLLRKLDRKGRLEWPPRMDPARAVAGVVGLPIEVVESALLDLQDSETIEVHPGALEWSRFVPGQNAKSRALTGAERTAEWRERKKANGHVTSGDKRDACDHQPSPSQLSSANAPCSPPMGDDGREPPHSVETPAEAFALSGPGQSAPRAGRRGKPRTAYPTDLEATFLDLLVAAQREIGRRGTRKVTDEMRDHLRKLWAACEPTVDELTHVIAVRREMDRRNEGYGSLTWDSLCRPGNFRNWLSKPLARTPGRAEPSPRPKTGGTVDLLAIAGGKDP